MVIVYNLEFKLLGFILRLDCDHKMPVLYEYVCMRKFENYYDKSIIILFVII